MENFIAILLLIMGAGIGGAIVWLALRGKVTHSYQAAKAEQSAEFASLTERLNARAQEIGKLEQLLEKTNAERDEMQERNAHLKAQLEGERRASSERHESF